MDPPTPKRLPFRHGRSTGVFSTLSQSFSFHASPELFLAAGAESDSTAPQFVRAEILNRHVTIISSFRHCHAVLQGASAQAILDQGEASHSSDLFPPDAFTAGPAYRELMADFFPPPNLLLLDGSSHKSARSRWNACMEAMHDDMRSLARELVKQHVAGWKNGMTLDLYEDMKGLAWDILCATFTTLTPSQHRDFVSLQETLLRGQFSLFSVSIRTPFWQSARSKGLHAREKLQDMLRTDAASPTRACPLAHAGDDVDARDKEGNALLFTSSIAVKALSSLLTASLLNLFIFSYGGLSVAESLGPLGPAAKQDLLRSVFLETERLSPPVIGVMRRVEKDVQLNKGATSGEPEIVTVPAGCDVWLYLVGASRDQSVFQSASKFIPDRFVGSSKPDIGFAFGAGQKECLGRDMARMVIETVASVMLDNNWRIEGSVDRLGVRGWLGWDDKVPPQAMAEDMKQLPSQRPRRPVEVRIFQAKR